MTDESRCLLEEGAVRLGLALPGGAVDRLLRYQAELLHWNRGINLIARDTGTAQITELHFLDSLTLLPLLPEQGAGLRLLDVGSGAGFPGLVLATALPEGAFTLMEPRRKRASFLRHIARTLGLRNVSICVERLEPGKKPEAPLAGAFTHITSRALAEPALFLPMIRTLLGPGTEVLLMLARPEPLAGLAALPGGPWRILRHRECRLPFSGAPRLLAAVSLA